MRKRFACPFQDSNRHFAAHRGKLVEKNFKRVTFFEKVEEVLNRHARSGKDRRAALNFWINRNKRLLHPGPQSRP